MDDKNTEHSTSVRRELRALRENKPSNNKVSNQGVRKPINAAYENLSRANAEEDNFDAIDDDESPLEDDDADFDDDNAELESEDAPTDEEDEEDGDDSENIDEDEDSDEGDLKQESEFKKFLKREMRKPWFWLAALIALIIIFIVLLIIANLPDPNNSVASILCGGDSVFDDVKVITTTQTTGSNPRDYTEPLDSWGFYEYVAAVVNAEFALDPNEKKLAAYQAQAVAAASFAIQRGGYYKRIETNQQKYIAWCGEGGTDWVKVNGRDTFKCPGWAGTEDIIILPNSNSAQTACDIVKGCYKFAGSGNGCSINLRKTIVDGYDMPSTWSRTCANGATVTVSGDLYIEGHTPEKIEDYNDLIETVRGVFLMDNKGVIGGGKYGSKGTAGCSYGPSTNVMCHDKRGYEDAGTQALAGWGALRILTYWYPDYNLGSKSEAGISSCEMYSSETTNHPKLNWKDDGTTDHVADKNFDFETFLSGAYDNYTTNITLNEFNSLIMNAVKDVGIGTRLGVVNAATMFINQFSVMGYRLSYDFGGKYTNALGNPAYGVNPKTAEASSGSNASGPRTDRPISFDCTGFFYWVLQNGGIMNDQAVLRQLSVHTTTDAVGNKLMSYFDEYDGKHKVIGEVGDAIYHTKTSGSEGTQGTVHAILVIGHNFNQYGIVTSNITAESTGSAGIVIRSYDLLKGPPNSKSSTNPYGVINLGHCYQGGLNNSRGSMCRVTSELEFYAGVIKNEE